MYKFSQKYFAYLHFYPNFKSGSFWLVYMVELNRWAANKSYLEKIGFGITHY